MGKVEDKAAKPAKATAKSATKPAEGKDVKAAAKSTS
jgi:hypothetical protein